jgi:hypothetical protein
LSYLEGCISRIDRELEKDKNKLVQEDKYEICPKRTEVVFKLYLGNDFVGYEAWESLWGWSYSNGGTAYNGHYIKHDSKVLIEKEEE